MDSPHTKLPPMKDLTIENITHNTITTNSLNPSPRLRFLLSRLVTHMHDFARETRLSTSEWRSGIDFLTATGQTCTPDRQEFILLSDILGLSLLVDAIDHPKPPGATEGSVLGPFHTHDVPHMRSGDSISHDPRGEPCLVLCSVRDGSGNAIPGVKVDVWETDSSGHYDVQHADRKAPDGRCVMRSGEDGGFWFRAIRPVSYPIPHDGPVGKLLLLLKRHPFRPAHMHFIFEKEGWDRLITALYIRGDPYETSDAVFGVKNSLLVDFEQADEETVKKYDVKAGSLVLKHDFVLVSAKEASDLRDRLSKEALEALGQKVKILHGLPVPDVD